MRHHQLGALLFIPALIIHAVALFATNICDLLVRPVAEKHYMTDGEVAAEKKITVAQVRREDDDTHSDIEDFIEEGEEGKPPIYVAAPVAGVPKGLSLILILSWAGVGIPLLWGILVTLQKALALLH